jgi:hypothetical protein
VRTSPRQLALGALLAVLLATGVTACGRSAGARPSVAAYVRHVQRLETRFQTPLRAVGRAGTVLGAETSGRANALGRLAVTANEATLRVALRQLGTLRSELAAVPAPAAASHLRALVLRLADRQLALTRNVAALVVFLPSFNDQIAPLAAATIRLKVILATGGSVSVAALPAIYRFRASALHAFSSTVAVISGRLRRLRPPPVSVPAYRSQLASLAGMRQAANALAAALLSQQTSTVPQLLLAFDRAATLNQTTAAQRAQIAAVSSYNHQVRGLKQLVNQIDLERYRLDRAIR